MHPLISVQDLRVSFRMGPRSVEAVRGVSFDIQPNSTLALVGESGSGKTVSAMSIVRLLPDNALIGAASKILYNGQDLLRATPESLRGLRGKDISVVFQDPMGSLNPVFTVGEQIAEVLAIHLGLRARPALARAMELLDEVGIDKPRERLRAYAHELSGGQQQRVMIAMAIACEPKLLIADEPTTALDVTVQRQIMELLARLQQRSKMGMLFISHDLALVGEIASQVVVLREGTVREAGAVAGIFHAPQDAYTRALLACRPPLDARPRRLAVIGDTIQPKETAAPRRVSAAIGTVPLVEARGLRKDYPLRAGLFRRSMLQAVKGVDFEMHKGRTLGVVGESGSGKTTLAMLLTRLTDPSAGSIRFDGRDLTLLDAGQMRAYRSRIQIIFQNPYASLNPRFTVGQILSEPMAIHRIGSDANDRARRSIALLDKVGLDSDAFGKYPHEFSGGQRQRIAIARCLAMRPEIIVCDESVSALDVSVQATVLNLLLDLQEEFGLSYLFISHDLAVVKYMADEILVMHQGEVVERGNPEAIYANPQHAYTRQLLDAIPRGLSASA